MGESMDLTPEWVAGFVDGEGCFHIGLQKHPEMSAGYQVLPEFVVVQHERDIAVLHALKRFFGCGVVRRNHGERYAFRIRSLNDLGRVCEFFVQHGLKTKKSVDCRKFRRVLGLMGRRRHLTREGLLEVIEIVETMNLGKRPALRKIRDELTG
jgi:hypothetical protein